MSPSTEMAPRRNAADAFFVPAAISSKTARSARTTASPAELRFETLISPFFIVTNQCSVVDPTARSNRILPAAFLISGSGLRSAMNAKNSPVGVSELIVLDSIELHGSSRVDLITSRALTNPAPLALPSNTKAMTRNCHHPSKGNSVLLEQGDDTLRSPLTRPCHRLNPPTAHSRLGLADWPERASRGRHPAQRRGIGRAGSARAWRAYRTWVSG